MRQWVILILACVALSGGVVAALATTQERDFELRGYINPVQDSNLPYRVPRLGVNTALEQYESKTLDAQLDLMTAANVTWVRQDVSWTAIEPEPGKYDWDIYDPIVEAVAARNSLRLILVLRNAPAWARDDRANDHPTAPPGDVKDFAAFAGAVAGRYGATVDHYQVWDEPNLRDAWGELAPRPTEYAALLNAAYTSIHTADADATVIAAALAPTTETGPENINEWQFLDNLYQLGAADFLDAVGAKPYGFNNPPDDRRVELNTLNFSRIVRLREIMVVHGDGHKAIWASNWGWNSLPPEWDGQPSIWGVVDNDTRTRYTLSALARAEREWPWLAGMTLQHWQPDVPLDDPQWGFALIWQDGQPTSLLTALAEQVPRYTTATNGLYPPDTAYADYQGVWTFGDLGADIGWLNDSRLSFEFEGDSVALVVREGNYVAYLYPQVNGTVPSALPTDNQGNAYILLTSPQLTSQRSTILVAANLGTGTHTLTAVADRGWDRWVLAGYAVSAGDLAAPYNRQIALAWLASALAALAVVVSARQVAWRAVFAPLGQIGRSLQRGMHLALAILTSGMLLVAMLLAWGSETFLLRRDGVSLALSLLTAGLLYISPAVVGSILAALVLLWLFYHRLDVGLLLVLMWAPFFLFPVQLYLYAFPMAELLLLIAVVAWGLRGVVAFAETYRESGLPKLHWRFSATDYGMLAFGLIALVSLNWATYLDPALTELRVMIVEPLLFYAMLRTTTRSASDIRRLTDGLLISGFLVAGIGLGMYAFGAGIITAEGGARRLAGVYGSPNNTALWLGRTLPLALAYVLLLPERPRRILGATTLLIGSAALALTQSAGALFIGVPLALAAVLMLALKRRAIFPLVGLAVVGVAMVIYLLRFPRFAQLLDFSSGTNFFRLRVWESAVNVIRDYPLTGLGLDQFLYAFRSTYILPDAWQEPDLSHPHNFVLDFWTRLGLVGVLVFAWLQIVFWQHVQRLYGRLQGRPHQLTVLVGVAGSMVNLLAHGLVDNSVFVNDLALLFAFLLAAVQVPLDTESEREAIIDANP